VADLAGGGLLPPSASAGIAAQLPGADLVIVVDAPDSVLLSRLKPGDEAAHVLARAAVYRDLAAQCGARLLSSDDAGSVAESVLAAEARA
jgi:hypothetical protein